MTRWIAKFPTVNKWISSLVVEMTGRQHTSSPFQKSTFLTKWQQFKPGIHAIKWILKQNITQIHWVSDQFQTAAFLCSKMLDVPLLPWQLPFSPMTIHPLILWQFTKVTFYSSISWHFTIFYNGIPLKLQFTLIRVTIFQYIKQKLKGLRNSWVHCVESIK